MTKIRISIITYSFFAIFVIFLIKIFFTYCVIPPEDLTKSVLLFTEVRINCYYQKYKKLPKSIDDLPILPGRDNSTMDGRGNKIELLLENGLIVLYNKYDKSIYCTFPADAIYENERFFLTPEFVESIYNNDENRKK